MAVYMAIWSFHNGRNFEDQRSFLERLAIFEHTVDPSITNMAWIATYLTATDLDKFLSVALDKGDALFIAQIEKGRCQGTLQLATWRWIDERV